MERQDLNDLTRELRYLLNRWDPIGIYDEEADYPPDEYDCMIGPLLSRLDKGANRADLSEFLWEEVGGHFGLDPEYARTDEIADSLVAWFKLHQQSS